jgi:tetratricopeptide (TPR) repeat protein
VRTAALLDKKEAELFTPLNLGESLHLLQKTGDGKRYDIHRLLRRVRQEQFPLLHREQWIKDTCQRLGDWFEDRGEEFNNLPAFEAELDHLKQWLAHVKPYPSIHTARLTWLQAYPPYHWGRYRESHQLVQSAFSLLSETSADDPKLKAHILNDLGTTYSKIGEFQKALEYKVQALEIRQQLFGEQHPDTAQSFNNVGYSYGELRNHEKALEYQLRALEIQKKICGEQHPNTATYFNNVGITYGDLGDHKKALEFQLRALEIRKQILGEQHPDTANSLHNVGYTYLDMRNPGEAHPYFKRAFDIHAQLPGKLHQHTAVAFYRFVYSLIKLKRFQEAGERLDEYLEELPQDHPGYNDLSGLKKILQKEKRKGLHWQPKKKKKRKK